MGFSVTGCDEFYAGFETAFDLIDASTAAGLRATATPRFCFSPDRWARLDSRHDQPKKRGRDATVFTYSAGWRQRRDSKKSRANGVWAEVPDGERPLLKHDGVLKLLAMGLNDGVNEGFTAWVSPCVLDRRRHGHNRLGPGLDRSAHPCLLEWRASILPSTSCKRSPGAAYGRCELWSRKSTARCDFQDSERAASLAQVGGGTAACARECTTTTEIEPTACLAPAATLRNSGRTSTNRASYTRVLLHKDRQCVEPPVQ